MIIEFVSKEINGVAFNELTHDADYYAVGHEEGSKHIVLMSLDKESPQPAHSFTRSKLEGFGSDSWNELLQEIQNRGLIIPDQP